MLGIVHARTITFAGCLPHLVNLPIICTRPLQEPVAHTHRHSTGSQSQQEQFAETQGQACKTTLSDTKANMPQHQTSTGNQLLQEATIDT